MSVVLYNRPQAASLWCPLAMESLNRQSMKRLEQRYPKRSRLILYTRKQWDGYITTSNSCNFHCFFLWVSLLPFPNFTFLSVQVSTSSKKPLCLLWSFLFYTTYLGQIKTTMRYHFIQSVAIALGNSLTSPATELPHDPGIPLLGIYPKNAGAQFQKDICTPMFITALFTIAKK